MCIDSLYKNGLIVGIFGAVFTVVISVVGWVAVPEIIADVAEKVTVLEEGNFVWNLWVDPPFPIYTDFYLFNCTNYEDVVRNGAKPVVVELGPYSYREYRKKNTSVEENSENVVYYREHRTYFFSQSTTGPNLSLNDKIITVNPVYMTISAFLDRLPSNYLIVNSIVKRIDSFLKDNNESVFMTVTADELIFKGWPLDTYIELYQIVKDLIDILLPTKPPNFPHLPDLPPNITDTGFSFGLFTAKNDTNDGLFRVNRGTSDSKLFGNIEAWGKNLESLSSYLPFWPGNESYCNKIQGTDGTIFPYGFDPNEKLFIYQTDLCRSVYIVFEKSEIFEDLPARRFFLPKSVLENKINAPENECFCLDEEDEGKCPDTGTIYLGACYEGAPLIGSNPHFYNGHPKYVDAVEGMNPDKAKHETIIILEERTGALLYGAKRVQLNFDVRNTRLADTHNLTTRVFLPMMWFEENVIIDEETKKEFQIFTTIEIVLWVLFACGLVLFFVGAGLIALHFHREKKSSKVV